MVNDCFPVIAIASLCGNSQIFFYEAVMLCPVKPPSKAVNKDVVLVTNEELNGVEHNSLFPFFQECSIHRSANSSMFNQKGAFGLALGGGIIIFEDCSAISIVGGYSPPTPLRFGNQSGWGVSNLYLHGIFSLRLLTSILYSDLEESQEIILDVKHLIN